MAKKEFFWKYYKKVSNTKTKRIFFEKNKLVSNDSEMSNSARNDKNISDGFATVSYNIQ